MKPEPRSPYILKKDLEEGMAYIVHARDFHIAIWDGEEFHGIRIAFGRSSMSTELHWDDGPPNGTVKPKRKMN